MNKLILRPIITVEDKDIFVSEIQEAFQNSYVSEFGKFEKTILPRLKVSSITQRRKIPFPSRKQKALFASVERNPLNRKI